METEKRLRPEGLDYLLAAIAPVFIIGMIGSLTYFLLTVFYNGNYPERLMWILGLYTIATVLIARIAIEQTRAYSIGYMVALGAATMLVAPQFFVIEGFMRFLSVPILLGLLVMIAFLADRITFDCTSMNEKSESAGIGLLQSLGLHRAASYEQSSKIQGGRAPSETAKRKHNPGVWILYFALLAIPLFGVGQFFVQQPEDRSFAFKLLFVYLFSSLCLLVLIALLTLRKYLRERGIGMETAFAVRWLTIGSIAISVLLLFFALIPIPSQSLFSWQSPLTITSRQDLEASRWGWGKEGAKGGNETKPQAERGDQADQPNSDRGQPAKQPDPAGKGEQSGNGQNGNQGNEQNGQSNNSGSGTSKSDSNNNSGSSAGNSKSGTSGGAKSNTSQSKDPSQNGMQGSKDSKQNSNQNDPYDANERPSASAPDKNNDRGDSESSDTSQQKGDDSRGNEQPKDAPSKNPKDPASNRKPPQNQKQAPKPANEEKDPPKPPQAEQDQKPKDAPKAPPPKKQDAGAPPREPPKPPPPSTNWSIQWNPGPMLQWIVLLVLLFVAIFYGLKHRQAIWDFIQLLLGRRKEKLSIPEAERETMVEDPFPPFLSFENPFASRGWSGEQIVRHLFKAIQSWGSEHRVVRREEETPDEYVRRLAKKYPEQFENLVALGALYGRIAYSRGGISSKELGPLQELWKWLHGATVAT